VRTEGSPMRTVVTSSLLAVLVAASFAAAAGPEPTTEDQKTLYALGVAASQGLSAFTLTEAELEMVKAGMTDALLNKPLKAEIQPYMGKIQELQRARLSVVAAAEKKSGQAFLDKAAAEKGATKLPSGVIYTETSAGTGPMPKPTDRVKVHYTGKLTSGETFDSSVDRGEPVTFPLNGVIPCWTEGVQKMKVGGKAKLVCPSETAYGDRGQGPIPGGAALMFEVQLLGIEN